MMHLSSVIPAYDTGENSFVLRNFHPHKRGSNLVPLAPEPSVLTSELPRLVGSTLYIGIVLEKNVIVLVDGKLSIQWVPSWINLSSSHYSAK